MYESHASLGQRARTGTGLVALAALLSAGGLAVGRSAAPAEPFAQEQDVPEPDVQEEPAVQDAAPQAEEPWPLEEPAPVESGLPAELEGWDSISCARCHEEVASEWARSLHGLAWVDPHYQKAVAKMRRPESCHGCHAPEPLVPAGLPQKPAVRERRQHQGVDCRSCHEGAEDTMLGPFGVETFAHPSERSPLMSETGSNALCISCHATHIGPVIGIAKDFVSTDQEARGKSCVGCHMAPVTRSHAHDPDEEGPSPARPGRSHLLQSPRDPAFLRQAFGLSAQRLEGGGVVVRVENRCGHRVPGLQERELELSVTGFHPDRAEREEKSFTIDRTSYLPADEALEIVLQEDAASVRVRGLHRAPGFEEPVEFLDVELVPGG